MKMLPLGLIAVLLASPVAAQEKVSFANQTVTMIIGYAAGGGTDAAGRIMAVYLGKYLPGSPNIVVRNMPGAEGMTAMNHFVQVVKPDGLTSVMGAGTTSDPLQYRKPQSKFDPTKFHFVGGVGRGGSVIIINKEAEKRLYDKTAAPVTMGSLGGLPRAGMQATAWGIEFLGWNAKWVIGYPGLNDVVIAAERGEVDMTATSVANQVKRLLDTGRFKILTKLEAGVRSEFGDAPMFPAMMDGKITEPVMQKGFDYYLGMNAIDKWLALPPDTPQPIVDAWRDAFAKMVEDPEFLQRGRAMSENFVPMTHQQVKSLIDSLGNTTPEGIAFIGTMFRKQGLQ